MSGPLAKYRFSKQEQNVLILSMAGRQDKEVAEELDIKLDTVRAYWKRIRAKTGVTTRAEVIALVASQTTHEELEATQRENERLLAEIVRRRGVEEELAIYREVFARASVGLAVDAGEGSGIIRLNNAFAEMHGYATEELLGRPIQMLFTADERSKVKKFSAKVEEVGQALLSEIHVKKDGTTIPVVKQVTAIDAGDRVKYRVYTVFDLNELQAWQRFVEG